MYVVVVVVVDVVVDDGEGGSEGEVHCHGTHFGNPTPGDGNGDGGGEGGDVLVSLVTGTSTHLLDESGNMYGGSHWHGISGTHTAVDSTFGNTAPETFF